MQTYLKAQNYFTYPTVTGYYGSFTWQAVAAFQTANNLESVGYVGPKTRTLLNAILWAFNLATSTATTTSPTTATSTTPCNASSGLTCIPGTAILQPTAPGNGYTPGYGGGGSAPTTPVAVDTTPPSISSITTTQVSSTTETIVWTTNEVATSQVNYGLTASYGTASSSATLVTSHSITLTGLTANTTYNFQISSADAAGNQIVSSNQTFTTPAYNYYVDSVNGSDSNSGTSPTLAFKNLSALPAVVSSEKIALANGSHWRQMLTLHGSNLTVTNYGSGSLPIIDASDIISNVSITKISGYTNVYNTATTTFAYGGNNTSWVNVWETGGTGDNTNGQFLQYVSSISSVDSTACSYYLYGGQTTGGGTPASATIYIHSCDGTNPITNGYVYEFSNRRAAIYANAVTNTTITGIEGRKSNGKNGPFDFENDDGGGITLNNDMARDCADHCAVLPGGSVVQNSTFLDGYWGGSNVTYLVFYEGVASGQAFTLNNNIFQIDQQNIGTNVAMISHSGNLANLGTVNSSNNWFIAKNGGELMGYQLQYAPQLTITGDNASQLYQYVDTLASTSISNTQYVSAFSNNTALQIQANGGSFTLSNNKFCTQNDANIVNIGTYTGTTITDSGSTYYKNTPNASSQTVFIGSSTLLTINNDIFDGAITQVYPYYFYGSGMTFTGGTTSGTANNYNATDHVNHFGLNNTIYTSLLQWLAAVSPQDSAAITTASGTAACTLPTIPSVS